jgi:hypothetical protein
VSGPFATATEFCEVTGLTLPSDLSRLQALLQMASAEIRTFTGQTLSQVIDDVVVLEPVERTTLVLPERPVTAVDAVLVNGSVVTDFYFTRAGLLHRGSVTGTTGTNWSQGATVTYTHGYVETDDVWGTFRSVAIEAAKRAYTFDEDGISLTQGQVLTETVGFRTGVFLSTEDKMQLADYGKVLVG